MSGNLEYAAYTNAGDRDVNEDSLGVFENGDKQCYVLCDGLGGHGMGDVASGLVISVFGNCFEKTMDFVNFTPETFSAAQDILMAEQINRKAKRKMKTTAVSMTIADGKLYAGFIGDSRLYFFKRSKVAKRTQDHSVPQMLMMAGEIKDKDIRCHPDRSLLLKVMGVDWDEPMYELLDPLPVKKYNGFLLCSDGFWELIEEKDMERCLKNSHTAEEWLDKMVEIVKANGANKDMDNFSAIAVVNKG